MNSSLPIYSILSELKQALADRPTAVLSAPTGSGKTTVVPIELLRETWLAGKTILLLEPRRLAARLAASFMAGQLNERVGETVGYRVRFDRKISEQTGIEVITEGVLVRRLQQDPELTGVGLVILDEFHERNLEGDLALALCLDIREGLRDDLRLLVMSATLAVEPLALLLDHARIVIGRGRAYPVENRYLPPRAEIDSPRPDHIARMTARGIRHALNEQSGDVLVFLPGRGEINRVLDMLSPDISGNVIILPLYGAMRLADQAAAVQPDREGRRRVILTTTIAETSLTIEGIEIVVDCGWKRVPRFDAGSGLTRLETVRISRASAKQRSGRAGRLGPGTCYRLWNKGVEHGLQPFDRPEILQADLAPLVLELTLWGVADPGELRWLDPPDIHAVKSAKKLLFQLEALDERGGITPLGRNMAGLPVHPRLAHMLLKASGRENLHRACDIAALVSERDILRGAGESVDLDDRLFALDRFRGHGDRMSGPGRAACRRINRISGQLRRQVRGRFEPQTSMPCSTGALLSLAYPDRIAALRAGSSHGYKLVSGRGGTLPRNDRLQGAPFLVVAAMDGGRAEGRIFLAAPLDFEELTALHGHRFVREEEVFFDRESQAVRAAKLVRLGSMEVTRKSLSRPDPEKVRTALMEEISRSLLQILPWTKKAKNLQKRILFLRSLGNETDWPDCSDAFLAEHLEEWLGPYLSGMRTTADLRMLNLEKILRCRLDWPMQKRLEQEAPTHIRVPSGSRVPLAYQKDGPPVLAVRLQELFGLAKTPTICRGRVGVLLHLLSPAGRPVQITDDLRGFWESSYHEVKKELKGRYPKHYWPDDPLNAEATARVRQKPKK
jgi:ATP-dependent helicase HrpB